MWATRWTKELGGYSVNPKELNIEVTRLGGYSGENRTLLDWALVPDAAGWNPDAWCREAIFWGHQEHWKTPADDVLIRHHLDFDNPVIAKVTHDGKGQHFIVFVSYNESENKYYFYDPIDSEATLHALPHKDYRRHSLRPFDVMLVDYFIPSDVHVNSSGGAMDSAGQIGDFDPWLFREGGVPFTEGVPFATREPYFTPAESTFATMFSYPDDNGVIQFIVLRDTYIGLNHTYWDPRLETYARFQTVLGANGYGLIYTSADHLGDVDIHTFSNYTGLYWLSTSELAATVNDFPSAGNDLLTGTDDDGYGDGSLDPLGSSILYLPLILHIDIWHDEIWWRIVDIPFSLVMTTGTAYHIVDEPDSTLDGNSTGTLTGEPWEYVHSGVPWTNDKSRYCATYVSAWSMLDVSALYLDTFFMDLDFLWKWKQVILRADCEVDTIAGTKTGYQYLMGDGTTTFSDTYPPGSFPDFKVSWQDLFSLASAYGAEDEDFEKPAADSNYDARYDLTSTFGAADSKIGWQDLFALAGNYANELATP